MREILASKIHKAKVTAANVEYIGSITVDATLMEKSGLWPNQKVLVVSNTSGVRLETYVIPGKKGEIQINGASARRLHVDEEIIIMGFCFSEKPINPRCILVNEKNEFVENL